MKGYDKINETIDMLPYGSENLYYTKGCNGFITPEGIFYKSGKNKYLNDVSGYYAKCLINTIYNEDIDVKYKEYLMNNKDNYLMGFNKVITLYPLVYFHEVDGLLELNFNHDFDLTYNQIITIEKLMILNNYRYDSIFQLFKEEKGKVLKKSKNHK